MRRQLALLPVAILLAGMVGCENPKPTSSGKELWGRRFMSQELQADSATRELMSGVTIALSFEPNRTISIRGNCNTLFGPASVEAGRVDPAKATLAATSIGCDDTGVKQDGWIGRFFEASPRWRLEFDELTLTEGETELVFKEEPEEETEL